MHGGEGGDENEMTATDLINGPCFLGTFVAENLQLMDG